MSFHDWLLRGIAHWGNCAWLGVFLVTRSLAVNFREGPT